MASSHSFRDMELLMDHNMRLPATAAVAAPAVSSSVVSVVHSTNLTPLPSASQEERDPARFPLLRRFSSSLASFSLAFAPTPFLQFPPSNPRFASPSALDCSAAKLPSQKKCISPLPVMPAISAAPLSQPCPPVDAASSKGKLSSSAFPDYHRLPQKDRDFGNPSNGGAIRKASIVWFRNDLRCHDNEALSTASRESLSILPVYVFDPREYGKSSSGFDKTGPHRAKFLLQCVSDLRERLKDLGSDLVVRVGKPEEVLVNLAKVIGADALFAHQEVSINDIQTENKVSVALQNEGVDVKFFWGNTLFHVDDLPFKLERMPNTYTAFREKVETVNIRQTIETPEQLKGFPVRGDVEPGNMPSLEELGIKSVSNQRKGVISPLIGGEKEALLRLEKLASDHAREMSNQRHMNTLNSMYGANFSSKISPWLAVGCLSPRRMIEELKTKTNRAPSSVNGHDANWLVFELMWRDFFRFITKKHAVDKGCPETVEAVPVPA